MSRKRSGVYTAATLLVHAGILQRPVCNMAELLHAPSVRGVGAESISVIYIFVLAFSYQLIRFKFVPTAIVCQLEKGKVII